MVLVLLCILGPKYLYVPELKIPLKTPCFEDTFMARPRSLTLGIILECSRGNILGHRGFWRFLKNWFYNKLELGVSNKHFVYKHHNMLLPTSATTLMSDVDNNPLQNSYQLIISPKFRSWLFTECSSYYNLTIYVTKCTIRSVAGRIFLQLKETNSLA